MNETLEQEADTAIHGAVSGIRPVNLTGVATGVIWTSPSTLAHTDELKRGSHWELYVKPLPKAELLSPLNHGIYRGKEAFPNGCCECMAVPDHIELTEVGIAMQQLSSKLRIQASQEEAARVFYALGNLRVWYALPFCRLHSLKGRSISLSSNGVQKDRSAPDRFLTIKIANPELGRRLKADNALDGHWEQSTWIGAVKMNDPSDVESLPKNWLLRVALMRIPIYLAGVSALFLTLWLLGPWLTRGGSLDLCSAEGIPIVLAFIGAIALFVVGGLVGHFPKKKDTEPPKQV